MSHDRLTVLNEIAVQRVMHMFHTEDPSTATKVLDAVHAGGGRVVEFTNRARFATSVFDALRRHVDDTHPDMIIGVGSVEDAPTASRFIAAGAEFIVSPIFDAATADLCNLRKIPYLPGTQTVTEIATAERSGVEYVKLYPATDPSFITLVQLPRPWSRIIANGMITPDTVGSWLEAGATAVGTMAGVPPTAIAEGDYDTITAAVAAMAKAIGDHQ